MLPPLIGYSFQLAARDRLYAPSYRIVHTETFVTPVVEHWLELEIAQGALSEMDLTVQLWES